MFSIDLDRIERAIAMAEIRRAFATLVKQSAGKVPIAD